MTWWRKGLVVIGALIVFVSLGVSPLLSAQQSGDAARSGTASAIKAAEAAQNTKQTQQEVQSLIVTAQGVQRLLGYVAAVQNGPQAKAAREATGWYLAEIQAICTAVHCRQVPLPKGFP